MGRYVQLIKSNADRANIVRGWERRRTERGVVATSDAVWNYINKAWPNLPESSREEIFQLVAKGRHH